MEAISACQLDSLDELAALRDRKLGANELPFSRSPAPPLAPPLSELSRRN